jgi:2EXR family
MSFPLFPLLPPEIRLQIWTSALPGPREIGPIDIYTQTPPSPSQNCDPVLLSVNEESRSVALRHYTRRDVSHLNYWSSKDHFTYPHYISFSQDILTYPSTHLVQFLQLTAPKVQINDPYLFLSRDEMSQVQNLKLILNSVPWATDELCDALESLIPVFTSLRGVEVEVQVSFEDYYYGRAMPASIKGKVHAVKMMGGMVLERFGEKMESEGREWRVPSLSVEARGMLK